MADARDYWFHHIIVGHAVKASRITPKYIEGRLKRVEGRPWEAEISGRLLSKAFDKAQRAHAAAADVGKPGIRFRHVMYVNVAAVREDPNLNVYVEATRADPAHANFVAVAVRMAPQMSGPPQPPKMAHEFTRDIAELFRVCDATNLTPLESLRVTAA